MLGQRKQVTEKQDSDLAKLYVIHTHMTPRRSITFTQGRLEYTFMSTAAGWERQMSQQCNKMVMLSQTAACRTKATDSEQQRTLDFLLIPALSYLTYRHETRSCPAPQLFERKSKSFMEENCTANVNLQVRYLSTIAAVYKTNATY